MNRDFTNLREDYMLADLDIAKVDQDPMIQFSEWLDAAVHSQVPEPNAMVLSTIGADTSQPNARVVLLKEIIDGKLVFYTNYNSEKALEMAQNEHVHLLFLWLGLERQVRIKGTVSKVSRTVSEAYFKSRPYGSKIGAWASPQSDVVTSRDVLSKSFDDLKATYPDPNADIPCPPHWGGYAVKPVSFEFWQGRRSRLHDRIRYQRVGDHWKLDRLAP